MRDVIEQKLLTQTVFDRLLGDILHGKLRPGQPLRQEEITARFGVSRTPVREAIQRLQAEGLVTSVPRRTPVVAAIPIRKVRELYEIRARLEAFATERAVGRLTGKQFQRLHELIRRMEALDPGTDLEIILEKNREFHSIIYSAADNETLVNMINQLWRDVLRLRSQYLLTPHGHQDSTREHKLILEALEAGDRRRAYQLVQEHCEHSKVALLGGESRVYEESRVDETEIVEAR